MLTPGRDTDVAAARSRPRLSVLGEFAFVDADDAPISLTAGSQRLLAFLALASHAVPRDQVAGVLYPTVSERRASSSLRSALSRLDPAARDAVVASFSGLRLDPEIVVDVQDAQAVARRLSGVGELPGDHDLDPTTVDVLSVELLPGWYEEWVLAFAERWRQLRLHALEALADRFVALGRFGEGASASLAAVEAEPLRESARAALIRVHLAEGNQSEARREFGRYAELLGRELGLEPTGRLRRMVDQVDGSTDPLPRPPHRP